MKIKLGIAIAAVCLAAAGGAFAVEPVGGSGLPLASRGTSCCRFAPCRPSFVGVPIGGGVVFTGGVAVLTGGVDGGGGVDVLTGGAAGGGDGGGFVCALATAKPANARAVRRRCG